MSLADWIAGYGAVLSTILAFREWRKRSRVKVQLQPTTEIDPERPPERATLRITVVNRSDYAVRVVGVGLRIGRQLYAMRGPAVAAFNPAIAPHDASALEYPLKDAATVPHLTTKRIRAAVLLSTGERFLSGAIRLRSSG